MRGRGRIKRWEGQLRQGGVGTECEAGNGSTMTLSLSTTLVSSPDSCYALVPTPNSSALPTRAYPLFYDSC